jgi:hypothetical protein
VKEFFDSMKLASKHDISELAKFEELACLESPIMLHIRLGDYKINPDFGMLNSNFFNEGISEALKVKDVGMIWLFSDEPEIAMNLLKHEYRARVRVIPNFTGRSALTLEIMKLGRAFVISNSSFSWWGATLRKDQSAPVFAPGTWFRNLPEPRDLIPPNWKRIQVDWT